MRTVGDVVSRARILLNDPVPSGSGSTLSGTATTRVVGDVITEARGLLQDRGTGGLPFRYSDDDLYAYFGNAMMHMRRFRPDLFETGVATALAVYTATTPFPVDENYLPAFIQYIVSVAEVRDDTSQQDQKATLLAQGFMENLQSAPYRYADAFLYTAVTDAISEAARLRPDLFHGQLRAPLPTYAPADAARAFPLDERYFLPVVDFVVGRVQLRNADPKIEQKVPYDAAFAQRLRAA